MPFNFRLLRAGQDGLPLGPTGPDRLQQEGCRRASFEATEAEARGWLEAGLVTEVKTRRKSTRKTTRRKLRLVDGAWTRGASLRLVATCSKDAG
jgi:hypothetical protein